MLFLNVDVYGSIKILKNLWTIYSPLDLTFFFLCLCLNDWGTKIAIWWNGKWNPMTLFNTLPLVSRLGLKLVWFALGVIPNFILRGFTQTRKINQTNQSNQSNQTNQSNSPLNLNQYSGWVWLSKVSKNVVSKYESQSITVL